MADIIPLFAVPVFKDTFLVSSANKEICKMVSMKYNEESNLHISNDSHVLNLSSLNNLKSSVQSVVDVYTRDVLHIPKHTQFKITTSWRTTVTDCSFVTDHFHTHSIFTGVIVLDASPGSKIVFSIESPPVVPKLFQFEYEEFNIFNSKRWWLDLEPDNIYIFPSSINHSVKLTKTNSLLDAIAFDTFVNGTVGEDINELQITT